MILPPTSIRVLVATNRRRQATRIERGCERLGLDR
jgi:hypothetical protein